MRNLVACDFDHNEKFRLPIWFAQSNGSGRNDSEREGPFGDRVGIGLHRSCGFDRPCLFDAGRKPRARGRLAVPSHGRSHDDLSPG
jgi:hypothetical protein